MIPGVKRVCLTCGALTLTGSRCERCTTSRKQSVERTRQPKPRGYHAAHQRIRRVRGPASNQICICGCGRYADEWALRHQGPDRQPFAFSDDPNEYDPMCKRSHSLRDAGG